MNKNTIIIILLVSFHPKLLFSQQIQLSRICNGGNDNNIYWNIQNNSNKILGQLILFGQESASFPFTKIDSFNFNFQKLYVHKNANIPSIKNWKYFISYFLISGSDTSQFNTDTLAIDDQKPDSTILDSVSVEPISNKILLGWSSNKTLDFSSYYLYNYDKPDPRLIENYKDTFFIDLNPIDPKSKSLSYDITSSDSCDNRKEYGNYTHKTICLKATIDTCNNKIFLSWNSYHGWPTKTHYIFRAKNAGAFTIIDSTDGAILNYIDSNLATSGSYQYYVRAYKLDPLRTITSTSNATVLLKSSASQKPINTTIGYVTNNINDRIEIGITRNTSSTYSSIDLFRYSNLSLSPVLVANLMADENVFVDASINNKNKYYYQIFTKNICGNVSEISAFSNNIVLSISNGPDTNKLEWNQYFTWNNGIENYVIYRSSGDRLIEATNYLALKSTNDTSMFDTILDKNVCCYYIEAKEKNGTNISYSNKVCIIKQGAIFYPNAISVYGKNNTFTFVGQNIDLKTTSIQIYNRWGILIYETTNMENGWQGNIGNTDNIVEGGVYFFTSMVKTDSETLKINGNITVIK